MMSTVTTKDIMDLIGVSQTQVEMAVYSGRLPPPQDDGTWFLHDIEYILKRWGSMLSTKRKLREYDGKNIVTGKLEFPKHTR